MMIMIETTVSSAAVIVNHLPMDYKRSHQDGQEGHQGLSTRHTKSTLHASIKLKPQLQSIKSFFARSCAHRTRSGPDRQRKVCRVILGFRVIRLSRFYLTLDPRREYGSLGGTHL